MIEVILTNKIKKLGDKNSVVKVRDGYANYLIAQGIAILGNQVNKKNLAEILKQGEQKEKKIRFQAEELSKKINAIKLVLLEKADEEGRLFGTITPLKIAKAYQSQHIAIDAKQVHIVNTPIKNTGDHKATLTLYKDLKVTIQFQVKSGN